MKKIKEKKKPKSKCFWRLLKEVLSGLSIQIQYFQAAHLQILNYSNTVTSPNGSEELNERQKMTVIPSV